MSKPDPKGPSTTVDVVCPTCGTPFARETLIRGVPAYKIIGGKAVAR